jgi:hypothetical protein
MWRKAAREGFIQEVPTCSAPGTIFSSFTSISVAELHVLFVIVDVTEETEQRWLLKT